MIYNLKKYRAINKFLTIDRDNDGYYYEGISTLFRHTAQEN